MISILFLILIFIWFYKKRTSYNPYDISLSHSSYYECAFCREEKCTEEVLRLSLIHILDEAAKTGEDTLTMTHDQIARYTGSAREVVSRMLKYFEKENLVELARGRVKLANKKKLQELARK